MQANEIKKVKIDWASNCFNCGHDEAEIQTTASVGVFYDGDAVECCSCGAQGEMFAQGEDTDICWYEIGDNLPDLPESVVQSLGEVS